MCVIVGLVIALLLSRAVGGSGYGLIPDLIGGVGGSFLACSILVQVGWLPRDVLAGTLFAAALGAVLGLLGLRGLHRAMNDPV